MDAKRRLNQHRHKIAGITLVEVLIAILLTIVAAVGLAKFQGVFAKEGGQSKARSQAAELAREKLDDLKSFTTLPAAAAGTFGYMEIASNGGGAENTDGTLRLPNSTVTLGNTTYTRSWTVTDQYYCANNAAPSSTNCATAKARPDFKAIRVSLAWTDADGQAKTLSLDGLASSIDPTDSASALLSGTSNAPPTVPYRAGVAPDVIAINLGGNQNKETTNPTPTLNKKGQAIINTIASYATIRYSSTNNTITREEFITLNCSCTQAGTGQGKNLLGIYVSKRIGAVADRDQAAECGVCCRDHHDDSSCTPSTSAGRKNCYDAYRPTSDYTSPDHNHYNANGQLANTSGNTYREACRLKRVDGDLLVAQDWNLETLSLIPESYFAVNGTPNTTNITNYGNYVKNYVAALITGGTKPNITWPDASTVAITTTKAFAARGLYLDYIDDTAKAAYAARITANDATVFQEIPFYEVNLTKLAQWETSSPLIATVRNDQLVSEQAGQNLYSRGVVTGRSFGVTDVRASTTASNTGVINEFITSDPDDGARVIADSNEITVPGTNAVITGSISFSATISELTLTASNGGSCAVIALTYSCSVPFNWDGTITPSATGYVFTPAQYTYTGVVANQANQNFTAVVSSQSYAISGTVTPVLASVTFTASSGAACSYTSSTGAYSCTAPSGWNGSITPSASGYGFTPGSYTYSSLPANQTNQDFAATVITTTYTISGSISPAVTGITLITSGSGISCTVTTSSYSCTASAGFSGSITPSASNTTFTPATITLSNVQANRVQNITSAAANYTISGIVSPDAAGTTFVTNNGGGACSYTSGTPNGSYTCSVPNGWNGAVTPSLSGKTYTPSSRSYTNVTSDYGTENYTVSNATTTTFTLSGTITGIGNNRTASITSSSSSAVCATPTKAVTSCTSNCTFNYSCTVTIASDGNWSGTLTPRSSGNARNQTFTPASKDYTSINSSPSQQNFSCSGSGC